MRDGVIEVHSAGLRDCAAELADVGYRLGHGLHGTPGLTVAAPEWSAAAALAELESAVHACLTAAGAEVAHVATQIRTAADGYEAADRRAAGRLARIR
jgi:hypothetical protein